MRARAPRRAFARRAPLLLLAAVLGCRPGAAPADPLAGEWALVMEPPTDSAARALPEVRGVVVFRDGLPRYPDDPAPSDSVRVGRAYLDFSGGDAPRSRFETGLGADRVETVHAFLAGEGRVRIDLAPHLNDANPVLTGRVANGAISGTWEFRTENEPPVRGAFTMRRKRSRAHADSASVRARRGVAEFNAD